MLLLITGCINVDKNVPFTSITNFNDRYNSYCSTIEWAINESPFTNIVFCENSNYDFESKTYEVMAEKANKKFEYLTFQGDVSKTIECGKGYGEGEIVKHALENSILLKNSDYFYKITGRLKIGNINKVIKKRKNILFQNYHRLNEVDTRFYGIKKDVFENILLDKYNEVDDKNNFYLEHVYYKYLNLNKIRYRTFYAEPLFLGKSGSTGADYNSNKKSTVKRIIKDILFSTNISNSKMFEFIKRIAR